MAVNRAGHSHGTRVAQPEMARKDGPAARAPSRLGSLGTALAPSATSPATVIGYPLAFASDSARAFVEINPSASTPRPRAVTLFAGIKGTQHTVSSGSVKRGKPAEYRQLVRAPGQPGRGVTPR